MKILYAGSPEAAATTLKIILQKQSECGFEVAGVFTNPPSVQGRHKDLIPTPVETLARENNIPVFTPEHLDAECREKIIPLKADLLVCFAYGHIFGPKFLSMFPLGGIKLHPSLLPKYRGCTPVPAAILNRDEKTAVTIQTLGLKMDEGDILCQKIIDLDGTETAGSLLNNAAEIGAELISELLKQISESEKSGSKFEMPSGRKQEGEASYTGIIKKEDGRINWNKTAEEIDAMIRAYTPDPGCWTMLGNESLRILKAAACKNESLSVPDNADENCSEAGTVLSFVKAEGIYIKCGNGMLCVTELQKQGKKAMGYKDFMNGAKNFLGEKLI